MVGNSDYVRSNRTCKLLKKKVIKIKLIRRSPRIVFHSHNEFRLFVLIIIHSPSYYLDAQLFDWFSLFIEMINCFFKNKMLIITTLVSGINFDKKKYLHYSLYISNQNLSETRLTLYIFDGNWLKTIHCVCTKKNYVNS